AARSRGRGERALVDPPAPRYARGQGADGRRHLEACRRCLRAEDRARQVPLVCRQERYCGFPCEAGAEAPAAAGAAASIGAGARALGTGAAAGGTAVTTGTVAVAA